MDVSCVVKVGGSLLDLPDLSLRVANFLADFSRPYPVVAVGGGKAVDLVREWDRIFGLGEEASHSLAVRALALNALLLEQVVPILRRAEDPADFPALWRDGKAPIADAHRFLRDVDGRGPDPLPRRWRVGSDSIAARMAIHFGAPEVVLLQATAPAEGMTVEDAARAGLVDAHLPVVLRHGFPRLVIVNLRDDEPREIEVPPAP